VKHTAGPSELLGDWMRRRFGRGRKSKNSSDSKGAPIDAARAFERISEAGIVAATGLEPVDADEIDASLAVVGIGGAEAEKVVVGFAPGSGGDAALATIAVAQRLATEDSFSGEAVAVAPQWTAASRRRLAVFSTESLPFRFRTSADASLAEGDRGVVGDAIGATNGVSVAQLAASLTGPEDRALFVRAAASLEGLAAKHAGSVRGVDSRFELVLLARRVAALHVGESGVRLETFEGERSSASLSASDIAAVMDRLEGALRKRLNDRRIRDGEDGLRSQLASVLVKAAGLRDTKLWPVGGGTENEVIDLVGVDGDGQPVIAAIRDRMTLSGLGAILDATLSIAPALPALLCDAGPPLRFGAPRLVLAASTYDAAVLRVLGALAISHSSFTIEKRRGREPGLSLLEEAAYVVPAASERRGAPPVEAVGEAPAEAEDEASATSGRSRGRGRGRRGSRRSGGGERSPAETKEESSEVAEAQPVEEMSLFDLADEPASNRRDSEDREGGRPRRGRGRRRRSGRDGDSGSGDPEARSERAVEAGTDDGGEEAENAESQPGSSGRGRRRRRGRSAPKEAAGEDSIDAADAADDVDDDLAETLAPIDDLPGLAEVPEYDDEEEDSGDDALAQRREAAAARAQAASDEEPSAAKEPEEQLTLPRKRAAIVVHADRQSLLSGILLARDLRQIAGLWVYEQDELMTFFRGVTTDLPEDTPIYVIGFTASPARDALTTAALYRGRLAWFDHHEWPPEDLGAMKEAIGSENLHVTEGAEGSLSEILAVRVRRSRFSDKVVELATGRFSHHDYVRWGRLWWDRLGKIARNTGDRRADVDPLLSGRPSDLAKEAALVPPPPPPPEVEYVSDRDFRIVHFHGFTLVVVPVPTEFDLHLVARIARERFEAEVSVTYTEGNDLVVLGADESRSRRGFDLAGMVEHLATKHAWVAALPNEDFVARLRIRDLETRPERFDELISEIAMGRSILER